MAEFGTINTYRHVVSNVNIIMFYGTGVLAAASTTIQSSHHIFCVTQTLETIRKIMIGKVNAAMIIESRMISALRDG